MALIVQKYGGSSVSTPEKIKSIALRIAALKNEGHQLVVVISAMGDTTDELVKLAQEITSVPHRRELDMLLSSGERIAMSLLAIALNSVGVPAISFTGSQAGIFTDSSHTQARIVDIKPIRVEAELDKGNIVVLAGFQGVDPITKEITTLGRGGSDLTAVSMAAYLKASECQILKDVPGVLSADPRFVSDARLFETLSSEVLCEMTYWGSQVLHSRAAQLADHLKVPLRICHAHENHAGTRISKESNVTHYEKEEVLSTQSHDCIREIEITAESLSASLKLFHQFLNQHDVSSPQILSTQTKNKKTSLYITGASEQLKALETLIKNESALKLLPVQFSSVSLIGYGLLGTECLSQKLSVLETAGIEVTQLIPGERSLTFIISQDHKTRALQALHQFCS